MTDLFQHEVTKTVHYLKKGKIILYPTDTIWGIGCDATNNKAVQKVYQIKNRDKNKSMIVLLSSVEELPKYIEKVPLLAYDLINNAVSPLTIIYSNAKDVLKNVRAADKSIAIRIVKHEFCSEIIKKIGKPLLSTSANFSGQPTPVIFSQINEELKNKVDYVVGMYQDTIVSTKSSTLIKLNENGTFKVLRP